MTKNLTVIAAIVCLSATAVFSEAPVISTYVVDGVYSNTEVRIHQRTPVFLWEYSGRTSSFTVRVSAVDFSVDSSTSNPSVWFLVNGSTTSANTADLGTINNVVTYRTAIEYGFGDNSKTDLSAGETYFWELKLYNVDVSSADVSSVTGEFRTVVSSITLPGAGYDIQVDWNNPVNPLLSGDKGRTKFRYIIKDKDRSSVKVKIFNLSGEYVKTVAEHSAIKNCEYTAVWDCTDEWGDVVPAGMYFVNLDVGETKGITRRIVVIKK
ncbi:MAG: hypothetical protein ABIJ11_06600 [Elusimicrobiota bacterium]